MNYFNTIRKDFRVLWNLPELALLFLIVVSSLMHGRMLNAITLGFMVPGGYERLRIAAVIAVSFTAFISALTAKKPRALLTAAFSVIILPYTEQRLGALFPYFFIAMLVFWLFRAVHLCALRYRGVKANVSALSIKNAVDSLRTGVLFGEPDGAVLLCNERMQKLMRVIAGGNYLRNHTHFYGSLPEDKLWKLIDGSVWMFVRTDIDIKRRKYVQITASDITEPWKLTEELKLRDARLKERGKELREMIENLNVISHERERHRAKARAHDILGERLTLMLRAVRGEGPADCKLLRGLSRGLLNELKAGAVAVPQDELLSLVQTYASIGVNVWVSGELPETDETSRLFADIIREAVTNAVRHGFATDVSVQILTEDNQRRLRITNNGRPPSGEVTEGGGLSGIRKRAELIGGMMAITSYPGFVLTVTVPEGENDD
jgi:signal transduction histidine kinase